MIPILPLKGWRKNGDTPFEIVAGDNDVEMRHVDENSLEKHRFLPQVDTVKTIKPILYISYDGLTDPLGRSQVLPYLTGCAREGHRIHVLSCEKPDRLASDWKPVQAICSDAGIKWHPLHYHKRPSVISTAFDLAMLRRAAKQLHRRHGYGLVHCRSYIPAAAGLRLKRKFRVPMLFDMRGFWPEEKTESLRWDLSKPLFRLVYRHFKRLESSLLRSADRIVSLTDAGKAELLRRPELAGRGYVVTVIPCCVDFGHFSLAGLGPRTAARSALGIRPDAPVLAYLGSLGGNYMLGEMLDFFKLYRHRNPGAVFLFVTQDSAEAIGREAAERGIPPEELVIRAASRDDVPRLLAAADVGVAFKQPSFSAKGCSPTKMGEMLAVGLPFIANAGVGDVASIIESTECGAIVERFDAENYAQALDKIEKCNVLPQERRKRAIAICDVELGINRYDAIYRSLSIANSTRRRL